MAQTGILAWSKTAASNSNADSAVNFAEGQAPSSINDSCRAVMASGAKYHADIAGTITTGGTSTAYTATSNQVWAALTDGYTITLQMHATNGAAPTLAVDSLPAKPIQKVSGTAVGAGQLPLNGVYTFVYRSSPDAFLVHGLFDASVSVFASTTSMFFAQAAAPTGWTKVTTNNDMALRLVSGSTGGTTGGTTAFSTAFANLTITQANLPNVSLTSNNPSVNLDHTHNFTGTFSNVQSGGGATALIQNNISTTAGVNSTMVHTHTVPLGGSGTAITQFAVTYLDIINCTKN